MHDITPRNLDMQWHEGEVAIQRKAGVAEMMAPVARQAIRHGLMPQHRQFFESLPFIVAGAVPRDGDVWATILAGKPGFLHCPNPGALIVESKGDAADPAWPGFAIKQPAGFLGIDLRSRRRNRLNGSVRHAGEGGFLVDIAESYGNCPQYIRTREFHFARDPKEPASVPAEITDRIDERAASIVAAADTFFIATYANDGTGTRRADVSHKAGRPGFARVGDDGVITFPDFAGNLYFNTLGNIFVNPKAGLLFVDFESGDMLQITGAAEIDFNSPDIAQFQGAERLIRIKPKKVVFRPEALPIRWSAQANGVSQNVIMTGSWEQARARQSAAELASAWRSFNVAKIVEESSIVRSLYLQPADGVGFSPFEAGQHLPIRVRPTAAAASLQRDYTLSSAPSDGIYRISVKREGAVSQFLHTLREGDVIEARAPAGSFVIDTGAPRPAIFLAAGIGVTPLLAMLRHVVYEGQRTRFFRPVWMVYAARSRSERPFEREIVSLVSAAGESAAATRVLSNVSDAVDGDYEIAGRITIDILKDALSRIDDCDVYLCGPGSFMQELYDGLLNLGIPDRSIHAESFGPASLRRRRDVTPVVYPPPAAEDVEVEFAASGLSATWDPRSGSLLDLAEANGLEPPSSCRSGSCGTCRTKVLSGTVTYDSPPATDVAEDEALICCALPAHSSAKVRLDL
jgi:ferredoxin-NADP reductase/predicted pyridoxine 5'-phosphate oxidase superfamily flavin-nucleotide-binding protein